MAYDVFISYYNADKMVADAVCHYIEERGLRCFIAPRDILNSDWAGSITAAIEEAKAFVIVVSEGSLASREVEKEITLATSISDYIFPFRIEDKMLQGKMKYHLSKFHWIDGITPPLEAKLNELADRVARALAGDGDNVEIENRNNSCVKLLDNMKPPRAEFLGRTRELQEIADLFDSGVDSVFLCGMGGIGKSEIAKAYAKAHREEYSTVVFASYETDLLHLITNDQAICIENVKQASATSGQGETVEDYYARKMEKLRTIVKKDTLLIIDNFDTTEDEHLEDVKSLPCKILWTSRTDFSQMGEQVIHVGPMDDMEDLVQLVTKVYRAFPKEEEKQAVREIIRLLNGHTYAVSLMAAQMKANFMMPTKMLGLLREKGLNIQAKGGFVREMGGTKATAYEYIQALFDFSALTEEHVTILRYLACAPLEGIDAVLFLECSGIEDASLIYDLKNLNWVQHDEENNVLSLHMLVKEMVWNRLTPTLENCQPLLAGVYEWARNAWNKPYEENCAHSAMIYSLLECFPEPTIRELDYFEDYATFAWIQGRFDLAEKCEHKLYALCVEEYGELSVLAGSQALRVAAVYHNMGDRVSAGPWYEKGLDVQNSIDSDSFAAYQARQKVARCYAQNGDMDTAEQMFQQNFDFIEQYHQDIVDRGEGGENLRKAKICWAFVRINMAKIYCCRGRYEEGLVYAKQACDYLETDTVEPSLIIYGMMPLIFLYQGKKDYANALHYARKCLEENLYYRGESSVDTLYLREVIGDLLALTGASAEAEDAYCHALSNIETYFPGYVQVKVRIEKKYEAIQKGEKIESLPVVVWS